MYVAWLLLACNLPAMSCIKSASQVSSAQSSQSPLSETERAAFKQILLGLKATVQRTTELKIANAQDPASAQPLPTDKKLKMVTTENQQLVKFIEHDPKAKAALIWYATYLMGNYSTYRGCILCKFKICTTFLSSASKNVPTETGLCKTYEKPLATRSIEGEHETICYSYGVCIQIRGNLITINQLPDMDWRQPSSINPNMGYIPMKEDDTQAVQCNNQLEKDYVPTHMEIFNTYIEPAKSKIRGLVGACGPAGCKPYVDGNEVVIDEKPKSI